jgi:hypothetical protein
MNLCLLYDVRFALQGAGGAASGSNSSAGMAASGDAHPEKRRKALHAAFEDRMIPQMKEDFPGLKMAQYKDKIFKLWEKSPENPSNMNR